MVGKGGIVYFALETLWKREESKGDCHVSKVVKDVLVSQGGGPFIRLIMYLQAVVTIDPDLPIARPGVVSLLVVCVWVV